MNNTSGNNSGTIFTFVPPLSRFYYPDTRHFIKAYIIIIIKTPQIFWIKVTGVILGTSVCLLCTL